MIAIFTKYIPCTNTRGSRIKAYTDNGEHSFSVTIPYPHEHSYELCHFQAVKALVEKHGLDWDLSNMRHGGYSKGYVFCFDHSTIEERA
jgi:hypothetical protein